MVYSNWQTERESAIQAAKRGAEVLATWTGKVQARSKGMNDLVTQADIDVQASIQEFLSRRFPQDDFLGEENQVDRSTLKSSRRWIVDPIDGTTNFVHGFPFYAISIGLEVERELVVGVILDPNRQECFSASKGQGAHLNGKSIHVSTSSHLGEAMVCVGLPAVPEQFPRSTSTLKRMSEKTRSIRRMGSAALSLAYVGAGRMDAFSAHVIQPWDVAAGVVIVNEAGGRTTNLHHDRYDLYNPDILASNGLIHEAVDREID